MIIIPLNSFVFKVIHKTKNNYLQGSTTAVVLVVVLVVVTLFVGISLTVATFVATAVKFGNFVVKIIFFFGLTVVGTKPGVSTSNSETNNNTLNNLEYKLKQ